MKMIEIILLILSGIGIVISVFGLMITNFKFKQILEAQGRDPNPRELELNSKLYGIHNIGDYFDDKRQQRLLRKELDPNLANWYFVYQMLWPVSLIVLLGALMIIERS